MGALGSGERDREGKVWWARLSKNSANKLFALQLPGTVVSGCVVFLLTATD